MWEVLKKETAVQKGKTALSGLKMGKQKKISGFGTTGRQHDCLWDITTATPACA
jgi:hypothetical protein